MDKYIEDNLSKKLRMLFKSEVCIPSRFPLNQLLKLIPFLIFRIKGFKNFRRTVCDLSKNSPSSYFF